MELSPALPIVGGAAETAVRSRADRLAWLVRLRWIALAAVLASALAAPAFGITGIHLPVLLGAVAVGGLYNAWLVWVLDHRPERGGSPLTQALVDFAALTLVLWASGGVSNPFVVLYFVHVLLVAALSGKRAALTACAAALVSASFLVVTEAWPPLSIASFDPDPRFAPALTAIAFVISIAACAYVANRSAEELVQRRQEAEAARRASRRDAEILLSALDRLEVGVEIVEADGTPRFQNRHLLERPAARCPRDSVGCESVGGRCPMDEAREGRPGACRFSRRDVGGRERVIEMLSFPLSEDSPAPVLRLHLDRTESLLAERRLLFAERLASLGRTVQGVAHDLNTPLATIQTLAADMRAALASTPQEFAPVAHDLDESAALILDEMRRCRSITQGLLSGRDLLASRSAHGPSDLGAAVDRAAALVFGTRVSRTRLVLASDLPGRAVAMGHDSLVQVFVNLLQNAADVVEGRPGARVLVHLGDDAPAGHLTVCVDDEGPGLAPGTRDRVFEPFFTTKPPGKGTGLGLYTAQALVREAGGSVRLDDRPGGGARARLDLPAGGAA